MSNYFNFIQRIVEETQQNFLLESSLKAFVHLCLKITLELSEEQCERAITCGEKDGGIDAIHINDEGIHLFVCDYANAERRSRRSFSKKKIEEFMHTWRGIVTGRIDEGSVNEDLQRKISEIKRFWDKVEGNYIPHTFYFVTNKLTAPTERGWIESEINYYMTHKYCYLGQEAVAYAMKSLDQT